jgi:hypothetical protein
VKNITIAIDDETYRRARVVAAERDASVSSLVRDYLVSLASQRRAARDPKQEQEELLDSIWRRHPKFTASDNLSRHDLHRRDAIR